MKDGKFLTLLGGLCVSLVTIEPCMNKRFWTFYNMQPRVVFVLGGPGAGKGTQCQKIVKEFNFVHLSAGDLLRAERSKKGSKYGEFIEKHIKEGSIVPVEITCDLLERSMNESKNKKFLIDGFPRNCNNLEGWKRRVGRKVKLMFVIFLDCPKEELERRCLERGASGSGRLDDNIESLRKRILTFQTETLNVIEYFRKKKCLFYVNADQTPDKVFNDIKAIFGKYNAGGDVNEEKMQANDS